MIYFLSVVYYTLLSPATVFANDYGLRATAGAAGLSSYGGSLEATIGTVVGSLLSLIGIIFFIMVIYGGILWMTAAGNMDTVKKSINTIISAAIGIVVVLSAYAITSFVLDSVGTGSGVSAPASGTGQSAACTAANGVCMNVSDCIGGAPEPGICPGPTDWQCCIPSSTGSAPAGSDVIDFDELGNLGDSCTSDDDCNAVFVCIDGACVNPPPASPAPRATGSMCETNEDCDSGACIAIPGSFGAFSACQ